MITLLTGDALSTLRSLPSESVQTCVTSPPYFGLRDYGVKGQIGLEATPEIYVARLVEVFREVRRVLRNDGTVWLNLGDTYGGGKIGRTDGDRRNTDGFSGGIKSPAFRRGNPAKNTGVSNRDGAGSVPGVKPKDLIGIPWRVAFALQADGWYLRSDIIWHKPNPMPESVTDRPTKAHEYLFLLAKSKKYYYDAEAVKEPAVGSPLLTGGAYCPPGQTPHSNARHSAAKGAFNGKTGERAFRAVVEKRNRRTVWTVSSKPFKGAHFATFPPKLIEPCILAGAPEGGTVLDCFAGAGTTLMVAQQLGRHAIGIDLNGEYVKMARERIGVTQKAAA